MKPRQAITELKTYEVTKERYALKLDANESMHYFDQSDCLDLTAIERYPDYDSNALRIALSKGLLVNSDAITVGNGSSELLDLLFKAYLNKGDIVLSFDPAFSMYEVYSKIYEATFIKLPTRDDFSFDMNALIEKLPLSPKIIMLCTPNNPTGYQIPRKDIIALLNQTSALVIVDEAYMEFSSKPETLMHDIDCYENLVVLRTFSKAYGLAGARLGYMIASDGPTKTIKTIRSPYHVNALTQKLGIMALEKKSTIFQSIEACKKVRNQFSLELEKLGFTVFPSEANFLWMKSPVLDLSDQLKTKGVLIRNYTTYKPGFFRITITNQEEMNQCLSAIKEVIYENKQ